MAEAPERGKRREKNVAFTSYNDKTAGRSGRSISDYLHKLMQIQIHTEFIHFPLKEKRGKKINK